MTSCSNRYQDQLDKVVGLCRNYDTPAKDLCHESLPPSLRVGIVGAGMSGLYSALLLQQNVPGVKVKIFEASDRVGGAVFTYRFSPEPNQYFEAGAMRIPNIAGHRPVFSLIKHLSMTFPADKIELIDFRNVCSEGNRVFVNNTKQKDGSVMSAAYAAKHYTELGFPEGAADGDANELFIDALKRVSDDLDHSFDKAFEKYKTMSFRSYVSKELGWNFHKINYVEVMCTQSNMFDHGLLEMVFWISDYKRTWKTIKGGMSKLPDLCFELVKQKKGKICFNARVESLSQMDSTVVIGYSNPKYSVDLSYEEFDAMILAIPLPFVRMITKRPYFGTEFEQALRTSSFDSVSKLGLRFRTRFWERNDLNTPPSIGGQSTTDLPIRWVVYPDYGVGEGGKGVLHVYNWAGDSMQWRLLPKKEKIRTALYNLQVLYPEVDVAAEYAGGEPDGSEYLKEAFDMNWWGLTFYNPEQFQALHASMIRSQGNIYFAGAHLASSLAWIMSALESAKRAVRQLATKYKIENVDYI